jgi:hypothetical protein
MHAPLLFCRHVRPNWGLSSSWMRIQVSENATRKTRGCYALRSLVWQSPCVKSCASPSDDATAGRCALGTTSRTFDVFLQTRPSDVVCSRQAQRVCLLFAISRRSWATEARQRYPLVPLHVFGERSPPASLLAASSKPHGRHNTLKNVQYLARCSSNSLGHASFYVSCRFEQTRTLVLVRMALRSVYDGCAHQRERERERERNPRPRPRPRLRPRPRPQKNYLYTACCGSVRTHDRTTFREQPLSWGRSACGYSQQPNAGFLRACLHSGRSPSPVEAVPLAVPATSPPGYLSRRKTWHPD